MDGKRSFCPDLSPLGPERRVQLAVGKEAVLQAGQELEQVASFGEAKRRSLDAVLADQHHRPSTVNCRDMGDRTSLLQSSSNDVIA